MEPKPKARSFKLDPHGTAVLLGYRLHDEFLSFDVCKHIERFTFILRDWDKRPRYNFATNSVLSPWGGPFKEWRIPGPDGIKYIHRPCGGPARIFQDGTRIHYHFGVVHRTDGPAVFLPDGTELWYRDGLLHRTDGPAVVSPSGYQAWFICDRLSRSDGPAVINPANPPGFQHQYYLHGTPHREDGPTGTRHPDFDAIQPPYFYGGLLHRTDGPAIVYKVGCALTREAHYLHGMLHRVDGPALITRDLVGRIVSTEWYYNNLRHCLTGPAFEEWDHSSATPSLTIQEYYVCGRLHRPDGPARSTWLSSGQLTEETWFFSGARHRLDGPARSTWSSTGQLTEQAWYFDGFLHRLDGPALTSWSLSGERVLQEFRLAGKLHRLDGPARHHYSSLIRDTYKIAGKPHRLDGPARFHNSKPACFVFGSRVSAPALLASAPQSQRKKRKAPKSEAPPSKKRKTQ